jgi:peptide/nickel transport system permease protein
MTGYILRRVLQIVLVLLVFQTMLFFILQAQPGGIEYQFIGNPDIPPEARQIIIQRLGLDRSGGQQYLHYLKNFFTGSLGLSFTHYPRPVIDIILERAPRTILLFLTATIVSFYTGFVLGKMLAWQRGGLLEYGVTLSGSFLYTVFTPWFGLVMIWIFAFKLDWFPVGKFLNPLKWRNAPVGANVVFGRMLLTMLIISLLLFVVFLATRTAGRRKGTARWGGTAVVLLTKAGAWAASGLSQYALDIAGHVILPTLTITLTAFAGTMLLTRNSMLETLREDYILTARAKGLSEKVVRDRHAARNALLPAVTSLVLGLASVIGGGIVTETIFSWPGMGLTLLQAAQQKDIPLAMGALTFVGVLALIAHLVVDILYVFLDPRIRYH